MGDKLTPQEKEALDNFVRPPSETSASFAQFAKEGREFPGIGYGSLALNRSVLPLRPGRVLGLVARSGHGKTTTGAAVLKSEARRIREEGLQDTLYVAHVSWEQTVEELEAYYQKFSGYTATDIAWGRVSHSKIIQDMRRRKNPPVWIFADSMYNSSFDSPILTIDAVYNSIGAINKTWGLTPSVIFIDYIQDVPVQSEASRNLEVSKAMVLVKRLASRTPCPILLGIQASRRVDDYQIPVPTVRDMEWSAVIEQKIDTLLALWRPIKSKSPEEAPFVELDGKRWRNDDNLLIVRILKQRFEKGYGTFGVYLDPATAELRDAS